MSVASLKASVQYTPRGDLGRFITTTITPGIIAGVAAAQGLIVQEAQTLCPVRTGFLRDSIAAADPDDSGKTVTGAIVATAPYAAYAEFGTGRRGAASAGAGKGPYTMTWPGMVAQPYLRPALDNTRDVVKEAFASTLSLTLKP